ncbi:MAG: DUF1553 domain-containing protein [Planctomycetes bacterium]|nr:DUF1553 domain-containing protein [Planctomycetota bacterium]
MPLPTCFAARIAPALFAAASALAQAADEVRYGRDVRPILSDRCFKCHGPDAATRQADLRLDARTDAVRARDGGAAIVPGNAEASELWRRIAAHDADEVMPPPDSGKPTLTAEQRHILRRWIDAGAAYESHWAFTPPQPVAVPDGPEAHPVDRFLAKARRQRGLRPSTEADRATLCRRAFLTLTGLPPTATELRAFASDDRPDAYERLVDRLLGEEPYRTRHAEHLAAIWLDAGRYADTCGIHMDAGRQAWAWRDWLIAALRDDKPFDTFVLEQLAGDLLPDATTEQRIATGFLRNHVTTDEGGAINEEYLVEYAAERTATVGSVFLGLTVGCARCHDHKYDPIRQEDYYRLFSFFNSNAEPGLYSQIGDPNRALEPFLQVPTEAQVRRRGELTAEVATAEAQLQVVTPAEASDFAAYRGDVAPRVALDWRAPQLLAAASLQGATVTLGDDATVSISGKNPSADVHEVDFVVADGGHRWLSLEALTDPAHPAGKVGRAPNGNAVLQHVAVAIRNGDGEAATWQPLRAVYAFANVEQQDGDYAALNVLDDDNLGWAVAAHRHDPQTAHLLLLLDAPLPAGATMRATLKYDSPHQKHVFAKVRLRTAAPTNAQLATLPLAAHAFYVAGPFGRNDANPYANHHGPEQLTRIDPKQTWGEVGWQRVNRKAGEVDTSLPAGPNATYVAQRVFAPSARKATLKFGSDDGFQLFVNGAMVAERRIDRAAAEDQEEAAFDLPAGESAVVLKVINTGGAGGYAMRYVPGDGELVGELRILALPGTGEVEANVALAAQTWREERSPSRKQRREAITKLQAERDDVERAVPRAMVMQEMAAPRATFVLMRGEYDKADANRPVVRELPAMFGALPADAPRNRLGLARWLVGDGNPLLYRVHANRLFEFVFGTGIVRTSEDFGLQGEWPSHPELLDWLALELRGNGHSVRKVLRLLVTSAAFRQSARMQPEAAAIDKDNRLLSWFPRRRLTAEALRDQALFVGSLLVERVGGPSVKPYQPDGLWQEVAMTQSNTRFYQRGSGDELWRRSLYTYWKRACPPPSLLTLDAPTREFCTIRRSVTNTPLQALVLWNDEQFVEAARGLAQATALTAPADDDARLSAMHERCTGHQPDAATLAEAKATLLALRQRFAQSPQDAEQLLGVGLSPRPPGLAPADLAALTVVASAFLNLDATLCID